MKPVPAPGFQSVWFECQELGKFKVERVKVFLRPVEFDPNIIERVHEVDLSYGGKEAANTEDAKGVRDTPKRKDFEAILGNFGSQGILIR